MNTRSMRNGLAISFAISFTASPNWMFLRNFPVTQEGHRSMSSSLGRYFSNIANYFKPTYPHSCNVVQSRNVPTQCFLGAGQSFGLTRWSILSCPSQRARRTGHPRKVPSLLWGKAENVPSVPSFSLFAAPSRVLCEVENKSPYCRFSLRPTTIE